MSSKPKGFSLLELMIALSVFSLVAGGLFTVLTKSQTRFEFEEDVSEAQQAGRNALDMMEREIRLAGFPKASYYDSALGYSATSNTVSQGFITVENGNLTYEGDINEDGVVEVVQYRLNGSVLQRSAVAKPGGGVAATADFKTLAENVRSLTFAYYNDSGAVTAAPADVRRVAISFSLGTNGVDPETRRLRTVSLSTMAIARNL